MSMLRLAAAGVVIVVVGTVALLAATDFQPRKFMMGSLLGQQASYFDTPASRGARLDKIADGVYTFNWEFDRTFVIDTSEGLVVVDPFNKYLVEGLLTALKENGIDTKVHSVVYTHYHLDHVKGAALLQPLHVLAHRKAPEYWRDFDASEVLPPTRFLDGDEIIEIGGVRIHLLYLGLSHTDTLYAVHLPDAKVLFAADTVGVRVFLPAGGISLYTPGYLRALDRMAGLDFETFVASHFGWGSKTDFLEAVQLQKDIHAIVQQAATRRESPIPIFMDGSRLRDTFGEVYDALQAKYGHWHGFDSQVASAFAAAFTNHVIGN